MSNKSASKSADVDFTPRRSLRCNKLDISLKEQDLRRCSLPAKRTPHKIKQLCLLDAEKENVEDVESPPENRLSDEKSNNQKRRNKKTKKQKAKANQKRKEAKKLKAHSSNSDENEDVMEEMETMESGFGASSKELSLTDSKSNIQEDIQVNQLSSEDDVIEINTSPEQQCDTPEQKCDTPESGVDLARSDVISLISPDLKPKDVSISNDLVATPEKPATVDSTKSPQVDLDATPEEPSISMISTNFPQVDLVATPEEPATNASNNSSKVDLVATPEEPATNTSTHSPKVDLVAAPEEPASNTSNNSPKVDLVATPEEPATNTSNNSPKVDLVAAPEDPGTNASTNSQQVKVKEEEEEPKDETFDLSESQLPDQEIKPKEEMPIKKEPAAEAVHTPKENTSAKASRGGPRYSSTPARKSTASRKGTPFKPIKEDSVKKAIISSASTPTPMKAIVAAVLASPVVTPIGYKGTTKTPLKSALRIRRSVSMDDADLNTTAKKGVVFHSPSNTTILIDEVDMLMKSKKKVISNTDEKQKSYVTIRRKRSMSVAETESEKDFIKSLQPREEGSISASKKSNRDPTTAPRVKLPNFAAIHQQHFEKMESISDHIARKNERAKVLSTSKTKHDCNSSISKTKENNTSISKSKENLNASLKKDLKRLNGAPKPIKDQPKARQRIELSNINFNKKATAPVAKAVLQENNTRIKTNPSKPVKKVEPRPDHQLNVINNREKMHMGMYKNSSILNNTVQHEDKKDRRDYIAGVRSNRRFMLQMQHRDRVYK